MAAREDNVGRDLPLLVCRVGFVLVLAGFAAVWWRLSVDDRFYVFIIAVVGSFALGLSTSFPAFCATLSVFAWVVVGFALFTLITGYGVGRHSFRAVDSASGILPLIVGLLIVGLAFAGKRLVRRS